MMMTATRSMVFKLSFALSAALLVPRAWALEPVSFNRDIRPIISNNCFKCHGPDGENRKSGLRLDRRDAATKPAELGKTAIVPGKPDESLLIKRIFSDNPAFRMPPVFAHKTLTQQQKETLRRWIEQGATCGDSAGRSESADHERGDPKEGCSGFAAR